MNCPKCNAPIKQGAKFCGSCGFQIPRSDDQSKCKKCGNQLKPSAKFCGVCGTIVQLQSKITDSGSVCKKCGSPLKPNAKFCGNCAAPVQTDEISRGNPAKEDNKKTISKVGHRIAWNIQQGEVALRINETEFMQYDDATGIIINDGIYSVLKANGEVLSEIKSGIYDFIEKKELDHRLNERVGGAPGLIRRGFRFFTNLILGRRVKDQIEEQNSSRSENQVTFNRVVDDLKKGKVFSVTMILEKNFPLVFEFDNIQTKFLDSKVAVHAFFRITDYNKFATYYLTDKSLISFEMIRAELHDIVRSAVANIMANYEQDNVQLPETEQKEIFNAIINISPEILNGISIEKIVTVSSSNEDLERLRSLSRELYLSEKELDHQRRLADFRNRMTLQVNAQRLNDARTENDFNRALNEINKDGILNQDDFDRFLMVFSKEKLIRESKNEEEIEAAMHEIRKTGLLREEDLEILQRTIEERREDHERNRIYSIDLMQLDHVADIDRKQLEWEYEIGDKRIQLELDRKRRVMQAEIGFTQLDIEQTTLRDDYGDTRRDKDHDFKVKEQKSQIEIDKEEMDAQIELLRKVSEVKAREKQLQHEQEIAARAQELEHQQTLRKIEKEKADKYQFMTPEQIMAANPDISPEVARAMSEATAKRYEAEALIAANSTTAKDVKENAANMQAFMEKQMLIQKELLESMMNTHSNVTGNLVQKEAEEKKKLEARLIRTEERMDDTQDKALNYTTKNNQIPGSNIIVDVQSVEKKECPKCKFLNDLEEKVCIECGTKF